MNVDAENEPALSDEIARFHSALGIPQPAPASEEAIKAASAQLAVPIPKPVRDLYAIGDGLWIGDWELPVAAEASRQVEWFAEVLAGVQEVERDYLDTDGIDIRRDHEPFGDFFGFATWTGGSNQLAVETSGEMEGRLVLLDGKWDRYTESTGVFGWWGKVAPSVPVWVSCTADLAEAGWYEAQPGPRGPAPAGTWDEQSPLDDALPILERHGCGVGLLSCWISPEDFPPRN